MRTERALRNRKPLPSSPANLPIVVGVGMVALTLLVVTLVR
jgi:uncharacterized membrane protein YidH (DUF202 family)